MASHGSLATCDGAYPRCRVHAELERLSLSLGRRGCPVAVQAFLGQDMPLIHIRHVSIWTNLVSSPSLSRKTFSNQSMVFSHPHTSSHHLSITPMVNTKLNASSTTSSRAIAITAMSKVAIMEDTIPIITERPLIRAITGSISVTARTIEPLLAEDERGVCKKNQTMSTEE